MTSTVAPAQPVVGVFDEMGQAERAVHDLQAAGFGREAIGMVVEDVAPVQEDLPAPPSLAVPFAVAGALVGGAALGVLAAFFAPHTVTVAGFGWKISSVLLLALVGGTFGWLLGGIAGYGRTAGHDDVEPIPVAAPRRPVVTVTVQAPGRPEEARTLLRAAGAQEVHGGDVVYSAAPARRAVPVRVPPARR